MWQWEGLRSSGSAPCAKHCWCGMCGRVQPGLVEQPSMFAVTSIEGFTWRTHTNSTASVLTVTLYEQTGVSCQCMGACVLCWQLRGDPFMYIIVIGSVPKRLTPLHSCTLFAGPHKRWRREDQGRLCGAERETAGSLQEAGGGLALS